MVVVVVVMAVILVIAGLVVAYVAYPHRGEQMPAAPWLGDAMAKAADAAPLLDHDHEQVFALGAPGEPHVEPHVEPRVEAPADGARRS